MSDIPMPPMQRPPSRGEMLTRTIESGLTGKPRPEDVNLRPADNPQVSCGTCSNYMPQNKCSAMAGSCSPEQVCDLYEPGNEDDMVEAPEGGVPSMPMTA